ncbi:hypothetical protein G6F65_019433 [Rhizopus arrhizus]|nr:hypothetical protein G6F65_019433 [Rhizopus arrhizus]
MRGARGNVDQDTGMRRAQPIVSPGDHVPAMAICSIRIEPVVLVPREMVSAPTATICWNMSARLPAMVISWTACWSWPCSTQ